MSAAGLRTCSRAACSNAESEPGQFLPCERCESAVYCSRICQKSDFCSAAHTSCALDFLSERAEFGPWTVTFCKQAIRLLKANPASQHTIPILEAIQQALPYTATASSKVSEHLQDNGIVEALTAVMEALGPPPDTSVDLMMPSATAALPQQLTTYTTVVATLLAVMRPATLEMLLYTTDPTAGMEWALVLEQTMNETLFDRWVGFATVLTSRTAPVSGGLPLGAASCFLRNVPRMGHVRMEMHSEAGAREDAAAAVTTCVGAFASLAPQDRPSLDHVAQLGALLTNTIMLSRGRAAVIIADNGCLPEFLWPLRCLQNHPEGQAAAPKNARLWWCTAYAIHMEAINHLCNWVASREGLAGLKALAAGGLPEALMDATDTVLFAEGGPRKPLDLVGRVQGAALHVQRCALDAVIHMAATAEGRRCLAVNGRLRRWLERAPQLHDVVRQQMVYVLASAAICPSGLKAFWCKLHPSDGSTGEPDIRPLPRGRGGAEGAPEPTCPDVVAQLAAPEGQGAMATLSELVADPGATALLAVVLDKVLPEGGHISPAAAQVLGAGLDALRPAHASHEQGDVPHNGRQGTRGSATAQQQGTPADSSAQGTLADSSAQGRAAPTGGRPRGGSVEDNGAGQARVRPAGAVPQRAPSAGGAGHAAAPSREGVQHLQGGDGRQQQGAAVPGTAGAQQAAAVPGAGVRGQGAASGGGSVELGRASGRGLVQGTAPALNDLQHAAPASGSTGAGLQQAASASGSAGELDGAGSAGLRECAACGLQFEQTQLCSGCMVVRYCGAECQRAHWKQHKAACKQACAARESRGDS